MSVHNGMLYMGLSNRLPMDRVFVRTFVLVSAKPIVARRVQGCPSDLNGQPVKVS